MYAIPSTESQATTDRYILRAERVRLVADLIARKMQTVPYCYRTPLMGRAMRNQTRGACLPVYVRCRGRLAVNGQLV